MKKRLTEIAARLGLALALLCVGTSAIAQERLGAQELPGARLERVLLAFGRHPATTPEEWDRRVCVGVSGVRTRRHAIMLSNRIALRVFEQGLEAGRPNCVPNVLVFVTPEADRLAGQLAEEYRTMAAEGVYGDAWINQDALAAFVRAEGPIRWWHAPPPSELRNGARPEPIMMGDVFVPSRLAARAPPAPREAFPRVLVVIDATEAEGAAIETLADMAALAAMAQLRQDRLPASVDSLLNRFVPAPEGTVRALVDGPTEWDRARLQTLYGLQSAARPG